MRDIVFALPPNVLLLDYAGAAEAFRIAIDLGLPARLRAVAPLEGGERVRTSLGVALAGAEPLPEGLPEDALLIVSGSRGTLEALGSRPGRELVRWLARVAPGHRLACVCSGALYAARAGLLAGRRCTTHHTLIEALRREAPEAEVLDNRVFVVDGPVHSSAGITAGIDLALHLIAGIGSPRIAADVAREMVVYLRRAPEDPALSPWLEGRNHLDARVHAVQDLLMQRPTEEWPLAQLAAQSHMSVRTLTRRFREATGFSVHDYHARLRLALARESLAAGEGMDLAAHRAGLGSARQLRRLRAAQAGG